MEVKLPALGEGIEKATVTFWFFKESDQVDKDADLAELATDKATFNLPCPAQGKLARIIAPEGATVKVGDILAVIE